MRLVLGLKKQDNKTKLGAAHLNPALASVNTVVSFPELLKDGQSCGGRLSVLNSSVHSVKPQILTAAIQLITCP